MALEFQSTGATGWMVKRNNMEIGKLRCTRKRVLFALRERKYPPDQQRKGRARHTRPSTNCESK